ncbi:MAG: hypothetical protein ABL898_08995 [Hyphomicrobiaceae bacterium]|nr:hypothetical protein [Hyphomicrobiaceae bacterium]
MRQAPSVAGGSAQPGEHDERRYKVRPKPTRRLKKTPPSSDKGSAFMTLAFTIVVLVGLFYGAYEAAERVITPKEGLGYYLGIVGALMMLGLLLYPARKYYKWAQSWGTVAQWFKAHMVLGIVGPALVVIHSGFELHSKNGLVAMVSMLLVVASGIIGRYVYSRLHFGLYGRRAEVGDLIKEVEQAEDILALGNLTPKEVLANVSRLADTAIADTLTFTGCIKFRSGRSERHKIKRESHTDLETSIAAGALHVRISPAELRLELDKAHANLDSLFLTIEQIGSVRFYERIFNAWHLLHLPLYYLLMVSAVLHVLAVHWY